MGCFKRFWNRINKIRAKLFFTDCTVYNLLKEPINLNKHILIKIDTEKCEVEAYMDRNTCLKIAICVIETMCMSNSKVVIIEELNELLGR